MLGVAETMGTAKAGAEMASQPRLVRAAHEFEGQMMKELLKPLTASDSLTGSDSQNGSDSLTGEDDDSDSGSTGALGEFAAEALGQALSMKGGFGIANQIVKQLSHSGNQPGDAQVTRKLHDNTAMRTSK